LLVLVADALKGTEKAAEHGVVDASLLAKLHLLKGGADLSEGDPVSTSGVSKLEGLGELVSRGSAVVLVVVGREAIGVSVSNKEFELSPGFIEFAVFIRSVLSLSASSFAQPTLLLVLITLKCMLLLSGNAFPSLLTLGEGLLLTIDKTEN
jgi:hypothetical protein